MFFRKATTKEGQVPGGPEKGQSKACTGTCRLPTDNPAGSSRTDGLPERRRREALPLANLRRTCTGSLRRVAGLARPQGLANPSRRGGTGETQQATLVQALRAQSARRRQVHPRRTGWSAVGAKKRRYFTNAPGYTGHTSTDGNKTDCGRLIARAAGRYYEDCGACARVQRSRRVRARSSRR